MSENSKIESSEIDYLKRKRQLEEFIAECEGAIEDLSIKRSSSINELQGINLILRLTPAERQCLKIEL